ncbi:MAG TPA: SIR2 family protein [Dehalococcoidia bacterium]|nr:SIR2 family protein [Dehalococcoidia bacterium]
MTTNYDEFMVQALASQHKDPRRELCQWNELVRGSPSVFDAGSSYDPTPANPVVYHLHGHNRVPESMVLTDDDYLDFLVRISSREALLPHQIQRALTGSSLLFVGYSLSDWTFRVLYRGLVSATEKSLRRISVTVQLPPPSGDDPEVGQNIQNYMDQYFGSTDMKVSWCTAREFCAELKRRWDNFSSRG